MKKVSEILKNIPIINRTGNENIDIESLCFDSRKANNTVVFFAIKGTLTDGHLYIEKVIENGCKVIVVNDDFDSKNFNDNIDFISVKDTSKALAIASANFFDNPSKHLKLIGVTGTNGKTTCVTIMYQLFRFLGYECGMLSTVRNIIGERVVEATHTTPNPYDLNRLLNDMVEEGCEYVFMECSSHAIHQNRIHGLHFTGVAFTNITHDHLDYHKTFAEYIKAKKQLFDELPDDAFALYNKDDKNGAVMVQNTKATKYSFSLKTPSDFKIKILEQDMQGMSLLIDEKEFWVQLTGEFNASNLICAYAVAFLTGHSSEEIIVQLSKVKTAEGRFDYFKSENGVIGIIDYAHTPDALENILKTINKVRTGNEQLFTIIGCGGNRDKEKRPEMARIACELSNKIILTSDNPRDENPETIIEEMSQGVSALMYKKVLKISNRHEAIKTAAMMANKGDIILLAGKGHEQYQEIKGIKTHFNDKEELKKAL